MVIDGPKRKILKFPCRQHGAIIPEVVSNIYIYTIGMCVYTNLIAIRAGQARPLCIAHVNHLRKTDAATEGWTS